MVIGIGISRKLEFAVVSVVVALGYTIVPTLIARRDAACPASRSEIEEFKKNSPVVSYLDTMFDDISHINAISGDYGIKFSFARVELNKYPVLQLYLTADKNRVDFIQKYNDNAHLWYTGVRGEGVKSPEELQNEFSSHFCYDRDGYVAKNTSFRKELEEDFLRGCEPDSLGWSASLVGFVRVCVGYDLSSPIYITTITECAEAHGFYVSIQPPSEECFSDTLHISF